MAIPEYDIIIQDYLKDYPVITKDDIILLIDKCCAKLGCFHFKIINNKLYICNGQQTSWETRLESFKYMILETLKQFTIQDCEFIIYLDDGINENYINDCSHNGKILPLIVTTSVLDKYNMILFPDFTFGIAPEYGYINNEEMCRECVKKAEITNFQNKIPKLLYRASANNGAYRGKYVKQNDRYDCLSVLTSISVRGEFPPNTLNWIDRIQKIDYKYQLHLSGHDGSARYGAYSSAFKWAMMCKSVVFYSSPVIYREFWQHPSIFRENEHYIYTRNENELDHTLNHIIHNPHIGEAIADKSFDFFKKYLLDFNNIKYYMQKLLNEYSTRLNYKVELCSTDKLINTLHTNRTNGTVLDLKSLGY